MILGHPPSLLHRKPFSHPSTTQNQYSEQLHGSLIPLPPIQSNIWNKITDKQRKLQEKLQWSYQSFVCFKVDSQFIHGSDDGEQGVNWIAKNNGLVLTVILCRKSMVVDYSKIAKSKDQTCHEHIRFCLVNRAGNQVVNKPKESSNFYRPHLLYYRAFSRFPCACDKGIYV